MKSKKTNKSKFPSIYRSIPEKVKKNLFSLNRKRVFGVYSNILKIFTLIIFVVAIIVLSYDLRINLQNKRKIDLERTNLLKEVSFWESFLKKNKDYRDGYLQLAILEYKLRNANKAKFYLSQALEIDPNFEKGRELESVLTGIKQ